MKNMQSQFWPMQDKLAGGHYIWDETTAKATFDYSVAIFGTDDRFSKSQWFA